MEEAYAAASLAVLRLASEAGDEIQYLESECALRSVVRRRPVVLGFVVSTLARKLAGLGSPHTGLRLAVEAVLSSYDPSAPHSVAAIVEAMGEEGLQAHLDAARGAAVLLPWPARLCLLHACLASRKAGERVWEWLPTAADSACSVGLQAMTTDGNSSSSTTAKGKGRAQPSARRGVPEKAVETPRGADRTGNFLPEVVAQVCVELAAADPDVGLPAKGAFLGGLGDGNGLQSASAERKLPGGCVLGERGGDWLHSFRFKLQALRDALLAGTEDSATVLEHREALLGPRVENKGDVVVQAVGMRQEAVERALERSRCGQAFVLAVKAALEVGVSPGAAVENGRQSASAGDGGNSVNLKRALETCLLGVGLPEDQGLLNILSAGDAELGFVPSPATVPTTPGRPPPRLTAVRSETRRACSLLQGLVSEGVRVRDLLRTLLAMQSGREGRPTIHPPVRGLGSRTGAEVVASVQAPSGVHRVAVREVSSAFVEWLACNTAIWKDAEGAGGASWEGDIAAAAAVITAGHASPVTFDRGVRAALADERVDTDSQLEDRPFDASAQPRLSWKTGVDPTDVLDRLVAGAAAAVGGLEAQKVAWIYVLCRVTAAAGTGSFCAYAAACVERSVALGGQAPFKATGPDRLAQAEGGSLWRLLEQACALHRGSPADVRAATSVLIRTASAAVAACRKMSHSWMISPGLLGAGPVRVMVDMLREANGPVTASDVLRGLAARPGQDGPASAADFFSAIVSAEARTRAGPEGADAGQSGLRTQAVSWLSNALAQAWSPPHPTSSFQMDGAFAAAALAQLLTRRIPYDAKPVVLAVGEAVELALNKRGPGTRRPGKRVHVSAGANGLGEDPLASLLEAARGAAQSPLLPLPVPLSSPLPRLERGETDAASGAKRVVTAGGRKKALGKDVKKADASAAVVMAGVLLDAFEKSPEVVRGAIREAVARGDCDQELFALQCALRRALCAPPPLAGQQERTVVGSEDKGAECATTPPLLWLGFRRAPACLLIGELVESGAPGWEETKAAMIPPPPELVEATEFLPGKDGIFSPYCNSRQRLTALRLELWLRFLGDEGPRHTGLDPIPTTLIPDVFRTARTLARAISRQASALITSDPGGRTRPLPNGSHHIHTGADFGSTDPNRPPNCESGYGRKCGEGGRASVATRLELPRQALADRLQGAGEPGAAAALKSWISSLVTTTKQFREWLPWQPFADELRELVQVSVWQPPVAMAGGGKGAEQGRVAATAAVFAACELLLACEGGEEVPAAVFAPKLCSYTLNTAVAPVPPDLGPPVWLEVLRCLIDEASPDLSGWTPSRIGGSPQHEPLCVAAAASVWIGGGGSRAGNCGDRRTHAAWVCWYGAQLGSLIPAHRSESEKWLILSSHGDSGNDVVEVRAGVGWEVRTVKSQEWKDWGRSPLQAAWNFQSGSGAGANGSSSESQPRPPPIALPPFASWLRVVLRGGPSCADGVLEGYMRRMAREVFLPCEFGGASGDMARQWLAALIEAEAGAEAKAQSKATLVAATSTSASSPSGGAAAVAAARRLAVQAFFREELLRFGSGDAPVTPVGGPLTWLWPLEAVVTACGRAGPLGAGTLRARQRVNTKNVQELDAANTSVALDNRPSALSRALCGVPHDLLCGSRRFGGGGDQPPPATLRAFATRAVDLAARALATPPCRHWSVARQLLLGLGLLYHALAKPGPGSGRDSHRPHSSTARAGSMAIAAGGARVDGEIAVAQTAALSTIESLVRISLGLGSGAEKPRRDASTPGAPVLPSACRMLRPLESGGRAGSDDLEQALTGAGAWRAANAFFGLRGVAAENDIARGEAEQAPPPDLPLPPPSALIDPEQSRHPSPVAVPQMAPDRSAVCSRANGRSAAVAVVASPMSTRKRSRDAGSGGCTASQIPLPSTPTCPGSPPNNTPCRRKVARLSGDSAAVVEEPASSSRRVMPVRATRRSERVDDV